MDHAINIDGEQGGAAEPNLLGLAAMFDRLIENVWKRKARARIAFRRRHIDALCGLISRIALLLLLATRLIARWIRGAADLTELRSRAPAPLPPPSSADLGGPVTPHIVDKLRATATRGRANDNARAVKLR